MTAFSLLRLVPKPGRVTKESVRLDGHDVLPSRSRSCAPSGALSRDDLPGADDQPEPVQAVGTQVVEAIRLHERVSRRGPQPHRCALRAGGNPGSRGALDAYPQPALGGMKQR